MIVFNILFLIVDLQNYDFDLQFKSWWCVLVTKNGLVSIYFSIAVGFYILLRAVDRYAANFNHFPGQFDG